MAPRKDLAPGRSARAVAKEQRDFASTQLDSAFRILRLSALANLDEEPYEPMTAMLVNRLRDLRRAEIAFRRAKRR